MTEPPLPHLTGVGAASSARKQEKWAGLVVSVLLLVFGSTALHFLVKCIRYIDREQISLAGIVLTFVVFLFLSGTYMVAHSLYGFTKWFNQRKEDAA